MSCKHCQNYTIEEARQQIRPIWGFEVISFKCYCKFCRDELLADFEANVLYRLGIPSNDIFP